MTGPHDDLPEPGSPEWEALLKRAAALWASQLRHAQWTEGDRFDFRAAQFARRSGHDLSPLLRAFDVILEAADRSGRFIGSGDLTVCDADGNGAIIRWRHGEYAGMHMVKKT